MSLFALLAAFAALAQPAAPLTTTPPPTPAANISVGDGTVDGSILKPYSNVWLYTITDQTGRVIPQGMWSDHLQATTVDGKPALLRVQGTTLLNGKTTSTLNVFDPKTLEPFSSRQQGPAGEVQSRSFKGRHLTTTRTAVDQPASTSETDLPATPFDFNGGMYGMILAAMPLKQGLSGTFDTVEEREDTPARDSFRVIGKEDVAAGARGQVNAWKVVSERPDKYRMTFWLVQTPPYIIKLEYKPADRPLTWDWTMI